MIKYNYIQIIMLQMVQSDLLSALLLLVLKVSLLPVVALSVAAGCKSEAVESTSMDVIPRRTGLQKPDWDWEERWTQRWFSSSVVCGSLEVLLCSLGSFLFSRLSFSSGNTEVIIIQLNVLLWAWLLPPAGLERHDNTDLSYCITPLFSSI